ncbi:DUF5615 family PIN-like protein [uncultured Sphingomonas sp.]|uniref:DUF5615 family PIN-like protein n=1 Tax=uncultured Sphingomonas sp. TaxID=158754 RepID=UPI0035C9C6B7
MRFLIDAQLPPALASWLNEQGHEADHVADIGLLAASDVTIALHVKATGSILVSKDADFVLLRMPDRFPFVWMRCGDATNRALQAWLATRWSQVIDLLEAGERFVEVR